MNEDRQEDRQWGVDESTPFVILAVILALIFTRSDLQLEISLLAIIFALLIYQVEKYYRGSKRGVAFFVGYLILIALVLATFYFSTFWFDLAAIFSGIFIMIEAAIFFRIFPRVERVDS